MEISVAVFPEHSEKFIGIPAFTPGGDDRCVTAGTPTIELEYGLRSRIL